MTLRREGGWSPRINVINDADLNKIVWKCPLRVCMDLLCILSCFIATCLCSFHTECNQFTLHVFNSWNNLRNVLENCNGSIALYTRQSESIITILTFFTRFNLNCNGTHTLWSMTPACFLLCKIQSIPKLSVPVSRVSIKPNCSTPYGVIPN